MCLQDNIPGSKSLKMLQITVCSCHVTYAFQSESTLNICLNVKELLARSKHNIWSLSDCNGTRIHNHLVCKHILNHLAKLAKWLCVRLGIKWFESRCSHLDDSVFGLDHLLILYSCIDHIHFEMGLKNSAMYNLWFFLFWFHTAWSTFSCSVIKLFHTILELSHHLWNHPTLSFLCTASELFISLLTRKVHPNQGNYICCWELQEVLIM